LPLLIDRQEEPVSMNLIFEKITHLFDPLHHLWEHDKLYKKISLFLVMFFLAGVFCIELKRLGLITGAPAQFIPRSHFSAIEAAFTVVLISQCFQPGFYAVFRNSGFALSTTMLIRIALAAPPFFNVLLGIAAAVFAIVLTIISRKLFKNKSFQEH
jgi:hypothetical protein